MNLSSLKELASVNLSSLSLKSLNNSLEEVRSQVYPKNDTEKKVYEAVSSANWGASTTLMNEIAHDTNNYEKFNIIMELVWKCIETDGRSWKQVFKTLTLIDHLIKNGSERVIEACRDNLHRIRSLERFNCFEGTIDRGSGVRERSKQIIDLLDSNDAIRSEREKARILRDKFVGISNDGGPNVGGYNGNSGGYNGNSGGGFGGDSRFSDSSDNRGGNSGGSSGASGGRSNGYSDKPSNDKSATGGGGGYRDHDDVHDRSSSSSGHHHQEKRRSHDETEGEEIHIKHRTTSKSSVSKDTTGSKLKVNIKKSGAGTAASSTSASSNSTGGSQSSSSASGGEVDLLGGSDDPFATAAPSSVSSTFDPFATAPASSVTAQNTTTNNNAGFGFDPFGVSVAGQPTAPTSVAFDPFAMAPAPPMQQQHAFGDMFAAGTMPPQQPMQPMYGMQQQSHMSSGMGDMSSMMYNNNNNHRNNNHNFNSTTAQQPTSQSATFTQSSTTPVVDNDFGDFESSAPIVVPGSNSKTFGDISKLVDLGGISSNQNNTKTRASGGSAGASNPTGMSFSGLDGFGSRVNQSNTATPSVSVRTTQSLQMSSGLTMMSPMSPMSGMTMQQQQQQPPMNPSQGGMMMMQPQGGHGHATVGMGMGGGMQMMGQGQGLTPQGGMMMMHNPNAGGMYQQQQPGMGMNMNIQPQQQQQGMMSHGMMMGYPNNNNNMPNYGAPPLPSNTFHSF